jgi:oxygen-independent coproporphyrinogen-3 oxidase
MPLGLYISVPFCRTKCTYCNFASDVFSRAAFQGYVARVCADLAHAPQTAEATGGVLDRNVNSVYLGGGTPTLLDATQLEQLFVTISQNFAVVTGAEVTVECAPGTLSPVLVETLTRCGVNRVSLGVQSFVDEEARAVGRLHTRAIVLEEIARLREAGLANFNVDLIAGLPHQTRESWEYSLDQAIASGAPHVSVYMLEVDEDSRLGRELIARGTKYHAHFVPDDDLSTDLYFRACERLEQAGIHQYEISNFARTGFESQHNLKYWTRQPYLGFGVDAHSMLPAIDSYAGDAVRFATPDSLEGFLNGVRLPAAVVSREAAQEESFFLGLRLNQGVDLQAFEWKFGPAALSAYAGVIAELCETGLLQQQGKRIFLTSRGRLLSNEVFERFIAVPAS